MAERRRIALVWYCRRCSKEYGPDRKDLRCKRCGHEKDFTLWFSEFEWHEAINLFDRQFLRGLSIAYE